MKKYGVILIGCGHIGQEHLADIHYRNNINVVAVVDMNIDVAARIAAMYNIKEYSDSYKKYLDDNRIDIAIVATYTNAHTEITSEFLFHGKHVLCEKPVSSNLEEGRRFFEIVEQTDKKVLVAHILRHNSSYIKVSELIASGVIGDVRLIRMVQNHHAMNWDRYKRLLEDCTPVLDCGVHYFDVVRWFTGSEFAEMSCFGAKIDEDSPNINYTCANFRLENGCIGYYEAGWGRSNASMNLKEFIGTKGRIELVLSDFRSSCHEEGDLISIYHSDTGIYETVNVECKYKDMNAQLQNLIEMIETNNSGFPTIVDSKRAFEAAIAAEYAVKTGKTVRFSNGEPIFD